MWVIVSHMIFMSNRRDSPSRGAVDDNGVFWQSANGEFLYI